MMREVQCMGQWVRAYLSDMGLEWGHGMRQLLGETSVYVESSWVGGDWACRAGGIQWVKKALGQTPRPKGICMAFGVPLTAMPAPRHG